MLVGRGWFERAILVPRSAGSLVQGRNFHCGACLGRRLPRSNHDLPRCFVEMLLLTPKESAFNA
jgi:hypothetical protein